MVHREPRFWQQSEGCSYMESLVNCKSWFLDFSFKKEICLVLDIVTKKKWPSHCKWSVDTALSNITLTLTVKSGSTLLSLWASISRHRWPPFLSKWPFYWLPGSSPPLVVLSHSTYLISLPPPSLKSVVPKVCLHPLLSLPWAGNDAHSFVFCLRVLDLYIRFLPGQLLRDDPEEAWTKFPPELLLTSQIPWICLLGHPSSHSYTHTHTHTHTH